MLPPYGSEEVAEAVQRRLAESGVHAPTIRVIADLRGRCWIVSASWPEGSVHGRYPFADATGVHTPKELADWVLGGERGG
jgi:hypothetical protein